MEAKALNQYQYSSNKMMSGAEMVTESLIREGVDIIFGYPGGAVIPIYDALYDSNLKHILARHEQGAIHAAEGYARISGKVGVCIATSGPGATNLVTGITNAYMDSIPLVIITGQVPKNLIGTNAFQEADITKITAPITKKNYLVERAQDIPKILKEAFMIARSGRSGPVLVDIPKDVSYEKAQFYNLEQSMNDKKVRNNHPLLAQVIEELKKAKKPIILAGGGIRSANSHKELLLFAEKMQIPVTTTLMGLGGFPSSHPLWLGMPGMHGTVTANKGIQNSDLLISLGARFDDRVTGKVDAFAPKAKIIHVDIDNKELGKIISTHIPINGDVREVLNQLIIQAEPGNTVEWIELLQTWKREKPLRYPASGSTIKPQYVIEKISNYHNGKGIIATDVGQHQMWTAQYYRFEDPKSFVTSGGLGTMGFGLPAAIGAQIANPKKSVVCITGDGSIQMNIQELATIAEQRLPIKIVIINNSYLGMVRQWQELFHNSRYSFTNMHTPDFAKLAEAYGILGLRASTKEEADLVLERGLRNDGPVVMEFRVEKEENVYPFVPAGKALDEMLEGNI